MSDLVGNPEDRFSRVAAQFPNVSDRNGVFYWKRSFSTVFTLNMKKILPMIDCSLSITRFVT